MYTGAVKGHADALAELPSATELPVEIVNARPDRVASAFAFFATNEAQARATLKHGFTLFEPIAHSLFLEVCSTVAFGFAFGPSRHRRVEPAAVPVESGSPGIQGIALKNNSRQRWSQCRSESDRFLGTVFPEIRTGADRIRH
jgi:hypothetical protein